MRARLFATGVLMLLMFTVAASGSDSYRASIEEWRSQYEERLKRDDGYLTLAGLFFLQDGENRFGSAPGNDIVLPDEAPPHAGTLEHRDGRTLLRAANGSSITVNGRRVRSAELRPADSGRPADVVAVGPLTMFVHMSGDRAAIRLRDPDSRFRREFQGTRWFPVDPRYRVSGRLVPYDSPKPVSVLNILGDVERYVSPGTVEFTLDGQEYRLEVLLTSNPTEPLWFIFRDGTSGVETYPAVRFLRAAAPQGDAVALDFNKAYNPPCAYNPFTTCPLPPEQNRLPVRIEAGELHYAGRVDGL